MPTAAHAYVFGEPGRLARPVLFVAQRQLLTDEEWRVWLLALSQRVGNQAADDTGWLARRHDLLAFLSELYVAVGQSHNAGVQSLRPGVMAALGQE